MAAEVSPPTKGYVDLFFFFLTLATSHHISGNNRASVPGSRFLKLTGAILPAGQSSSPSLPVWFLLPLLGVLPLSSSWVRGPSPQSSY